MQLHGICYQFQYKAIFYCPKRLSNNLLFDIP